MEEEHLNQLMLCTTPAYKGCSCSLSAVIYAMTNHNLKEIKSIFSPGLDNTLSQSTNSHKSYDEKKKGETHLKEIVLVIYINWH